MRFPLLFAIVMLIFNCLVDYSIYRILKRQLKWRQLAKCHLIFAIICYLVLLITICLPKRSGSEDSLVCVMWMLYAIISIYLPKYIFLIFNLIAGVPRLWKGKRANVVTYSGIVLGAIIFLLMWWGALFNRFNIQVNEVEVPISGLPAAFEDFRIAQISDLHVGTYGDNTEFVEKLVNRINGLNPDVIVFTGDMVNRQSDEFKPFISAISQLHAPYGVYAIMGNHDYGDYRSWDSESDKDNDVRSLKSMEAQAGLRMLNNSSEWIHIDNDSIALIGVENIGDPPFKTYGSLYTAYSNLGDNNIKVLLSHNPAHWEKDIENNDSSNIALTLSGHTHAMQIELFGYSPAALRYDKWGGLYTDSKGQRLYVNIGAGTVGMPYRIGANPEITLLTLKNNQQ